MGPVPSLSVVKWPEARFAGLPGLFAAWRRAHTSLSVRRQVVVGGYVYFFPFRGCHKAGIFVPGNVFSHRGGARPPTSTFVVCSYREQADDHVGSSAEAARARLHAPPSFK